MRFPIGGSAESKQLARVSSVAASRPAKSGLRAVVHLQLARALETRAEHNWARVSLEGVAHRTQAGDSSLGVSRSLAAQVNELRWRPLELGRPLLGSTRHSRVERSFGASGSRTQAERRSSFDPQKRGSRAETRAPPPHLWLDLLPASPLARPLAAWVWRQICIFSLAVASFKSSNCQIAHSKERSLALGSEGWALSRELTSHWDQSQTNRPTRTRSLRFQFQFRFPFAFAFPFMPSDGPS